ncbi:hypothetical protein D3C87_1832560 [compost metagenome]
MSAVAVGGEAGHWIEAGAAAGDQIEGTAGEYASDQLGENVGHEFACVESPAGPQTEANRWVEMAAGDRPDGIGHRHYSQAKG